MISGLDTTFVVQAEVLEHPDHGASRTFLIRAIQEGHQLALAPQVLAEFIHIVTDPGRFAKPLPLPEAVARAKLWWESREIKQVFPDAEAMRLFADWMVRFRLGRKRIPGTMLAATYSANDIHSVITSNARDFDIYEAFEVMVPV